MIKHLSEINLESLKQNYQKIHYFGLGFIQLKIDNIYRLHFYTAKLPMIVSQEEVHNHRYNFKSLILKGCLTQDKYQLTEGSTHVIEDESCNAQIMAPARNELCSLKHLEKETYQEGITYSITHTELHKISAVDCITLVSRGLYEKEFAQVVRKIGEDKICPFSQVIEESNLWKIVEEMITNKKGLK